ncbi:MAG: prolyl oligopeptidase family serine peptidase [Chthoniobacter sp.]|uniref:alpha/beta hydrolase family protein n=1 Tax=Chthoniobacter sp. TaxID=2510640 RepID=UPI0032A34272
MRFPVSLLAALILSAALAPVVLAADAPPTAPQPGPTPLPATWNGYQKLEFDVAGHHATVVKPRTPAAGNPWIWRTEFFGHEPQGDIALLGLGWHVAYISISNMYGSPASVDLMDQFHDYVVKTYGLNPRAVLEGFSRGGLYAVNFAATHPDKTAALYLDAPVLDLRSWPGGKGTGKGDAHCWQQALEIYGLTEDTAKDFKGNPLDRLAPLIAAKIPVLTICGDSDKVVPYTENSAILVERFKAANANVSVILKPGGDHHPHSLKDPQPIVDFLTQYAYPK